MINTREIANEYRLSHWAQIMQERTARCISIKEYCKHLGICGNTYYYWQRRVREAACEQLTKLEPAQNSPAQPGFSEVVVYEPTSQPPMEAVSQLHIEVSGLQITADSTYPPDKLAALLRALTQPC